jgi:CRP-like cAMP-binding protein
MALDDDIRILSGVRLFESFTQEQLRLLAFGAETVRLSRDRKLYREDDGADTAYVVVSGSISLFREQDGQRIVVGAAGPGSMLGELALIAEARRPTSAAAVGDAELIRLGRKMFRRILEEYPETAAALHRRILADLQAMLGRIEELAPRFAD